MGIEWDEKVETKRRVRMVVSEYGPTFRDATIDDLRRACEAAGLVVETVELAESDREDRDALRDSLQKMHDERDACLDALAEHVSPDGTVPTPRMVRPSSVLAGIRSLQGRLRDARSDYREHDAALEAAVERAEKAEAKLARLRTIGVSVRDDGTIVDTSEPNPPPTGSPFPARIATLEADLAAAKARIAELEAPMPEATVEELEAVFNTSYSVEAEVDHSALSGPAACVMAGIRAVAERVRRERCLIARAMAKGGVAVTVEPGATGYNILVNRDAVRETLVKTSVPAAEVRRVLARMLTEVGA